MFDRVRIIFVLLLIISHNTFSQEVEVRGQFQTDSIKIGLMFPYALSASYPNTATVLFPDSTFSFEPFEIHHKTYFPTRTTGKISFDSVVYYLTSFEIDSVQRLALPVFVVHPKDCTTIFANLDSVFLQQLVKHVPDSISAKELPLLTNTSYQSVSWLLNYPLLIILVVILLISSIVIWITFGKRIKKYFIIRRLTHKHQKFKLEFDSSMQTLQEKYSSRLVEDTLLVWKKYMEFLLASPFTKFTTKEIYSRVKDENLAQALRKIDWNIYGESEGSIEIKLFVDLQKFAERKFNEKIKEVENG